MKKLTLTILILLTVVAASACASADVQYTLTDDNKTIVHYELVLDKSDKDVSTYLSQIGSYWAEQGMSIYVDKEKSSVSGDKTIESDTVKQAAGEFSGVFTSKDSLFTNVSFTYSPSLAVDDYTLKADIALNDVIRQKQAQSIPADQITELEDAAKKGEYRISVSLPGDVIDTNADSRDGNICTWKLEYGAIKTLNLHTQKQNTQTVQNYNKLAGIMADNNMLLIIFSSTAGVCVVMIVLSIVIRKVRSKRASEIRVKHFR